MLLNSGTIVALIQAYIVIQELQRKKSDELG